MTCVSLSEGRVNYDGRQNYFLPHHSPTAGKPTVMQVEARGREIGAASH
jgi:hypothetical protein